MHRRILTLAIATLTMCYPSFAQTSNPQAISNHPINFEPNQGQTDPQVRYLAHLNRGSVFFTPNEAVLSLYSRNSEGHPQADVLRIRWMGPTTRTTISAEEDLPGKVNYMIGTDPAKWHVNVPTFAKVRYHGLYKGVDATFYGRQGELEYDVVLAPGADVHKVRFAFDGAREISIAKNGDLVLKLEDGEVRQHLPKVYQEIAGRQRTLPANYVIAEDHTVGFEVRGVDAKHALVIDPTLAYSTYLGSTTFDAVYGVAVDQYGRAYVTGYTTSGFPTKNPAQGDQPGSDAFVSKFWATGGGLIYSIYLGGSSYDNGNAIAVDRSGYAYIVGETNSTDFPFTAGSYKSPDTDNDDGFIVKLSPSGSKIEYAADYGGGDHDTINAVALDSLHRVYITGYACSTNLPVVNAYQSVDTSQNCADGGGSAFVARLNAAGTALDYSTYLDGGFFSWGSGIAVDSSYSAYITGYTESPDFPTTPGAFQKTMPAPGDNVGVRSGFVTKFSPTGTTLAWSTFLGGSVSDQINAIAIDSSNRAYVTGTATSPDFPVTSGAYQKTMKGKYTAFVTKLWATGGGLIYSTFLGGSGGDAGNSIAVDSKGEAHVTGSTGSKDFPVKSAIQSTNHGGQDAFVTKVSASGGSLVYSTYLGGSADDVGNCIRVDANDAAYVGGNTSSSNFPTTSGAFSRTYKGQTDGWVAKINP